MCNELQIRIHRSANRVTVANLGWFPNDQCSYANHHAECNEAAQRCMDVADWRECPQWFLVQQGHPRTTRQLGRTYGELLQGCVK